MFFLLLVQFYRQSVRVAEEYKLLACIFVHAYWFVLYALAVEFADSSREIVYLESQVTQTDCLGFSAKIHQLSLVSKF